MKVDLPSLATDPLGEALHVLRPSGLMYVRCHFTAPWGLALPPLEQMAMFHVVIAGECWLSSPDSPPRKLRRGDLVLVPRGAGHLLQAEPGDAPTPLFEAPTERISERFEIIRLGGGGAAAELVCGTVKFDHPAAGQLIEMLPCVICIEALDRMPHEWLHALLGLMASEASSLKIGGESVITKLADILVILAIRSWVERADTASTGWLRAMRDRQIGRAIALIHRDPARDWTLAELAKAVAMSRSAFAARFNQLAGVTVMQYITRWRMQIATAALQEHGTRISELASTLGYQSDAAFSRAFKRFAGVAPSAMRSQSGTG